MARLVYSLLLYLASPLVWVRLLWRSRRQPEYLRHLGERWGFYAAKSALPVIWVHAVSVGETRAAEPLVRALIARYPGHALLLTGMTPTGREAALQVYGNSVVQAYLPYDYLGAVSRFLKHFQPRCGVLMETEVWPNLLATCAASRIPVFLANARLSERSARGYARFGALARPAFAALSGAAAQDEADAARLLALGVKTVVVCGNLKFDVRVPEAMKDQGRRWRDALDKRPIWLAASTREGEEELVLDALARVGGDALLVLVPRHPQRFKAVAELLDQRGLATVCRSVGLPNAQTRIWLGDSMGEMVAYYTLADVAFVGGSLLPLGGQNLIEAAACGCPVLVGPHTFNFA
ncbi:MAG: lipid IV(A) 3-deoxy-D-manno-octulosonic acid transferase, partial [Betaproteobacteria bacterium]